MNLTSTAKIIYGIHMTSRKIIQKISYTKENPDYVIFRLDSKYLGLVNTYFLHRSEITSTFFFSTESKLYAICRFCNPSQRAIPLSEFPDGVATTQSLLRNLEYNLQGKYVEGFGSIKKFGRDLKNRKKCIATIDLFEHEQSHCLLEAFSAKHNFTTERDSPNRGIVQLSNPLLKFHSFGQVIHHMRGTWHYWFNYGQVHHSYTFASVTRPISWGNLDTFLMPFDASTWACSLATVFLTVVILTASHFSIENMKKKLFWTISVILGQNEESEVKSNLKNLGYFIPIWYFVAVLLTNFYQGALFSFMTATHPPAVPTSLKEILDHGIPIFTSTPDERGSMFKDVIIVDLMESVWKDGGLLVRLKNATHLEGGIVRVATQVMKGLSTETSSVVTSPIFVIIDDVKVMQSLLVVLKALGPPLFVKSYQQALPFTIRSIWVGRRNVMFPIISRALAQLEESGIYGRWEKLEDLRKYRKNAETVLGHGSREYRIVVANLNADLKFEIVFAEANAVRLETVEIVFAFCSIFLFLGILSFVWEVYRDKNIGVKWDRLWKYGA
ncbi:hypothetical protein Fcan01_11544 [Folsomia candida]|uniref:Uncharacterized protein n=1 Tax=Folsomia candida TaxID=158441 RepID=A0A226E8N9_FOLCA|nr:hypothetical protein Fcan01_11544 [Folsomia candida]